MKFVLGNGSNDKNRKQIASPIEEDEESPNNSDHGEGSDSRNNSTSSADEEATFHDSNPYLESDHEHDFHSAYGGSPIYNSPIFANVIRHNNDEPLTTEGKPEPLNGNRRFETENLNISNLSNVTVHANGVNSGSPIGNSPIFANVIRHNNNKSLTTEGKFEPLNGNRRFETENLNISNLSNVTVHANGVKSGYNLGEVQDGKAKIRCCLPICNLSFNLRRKHKRNSTQ